MFVVLPNGSRAEQHIETVTCRSAQENSVWIHALIVRDIHIDKAFCLQLYAYEFILLYILYKKSGNPLPERCVGLCITLCTEWIVQQHIKTLMFCTKV